jgi:hypothetical protein
VGTGIGNITERITDFGEALPEATACDWRSAR